MEEAVFGAGCFWGVQSSFDRLNGVVRTEVGYSGGHTRNPSYKDVCTDRTGHAEVVKVVFDNSLISYRKLLDHFFEIHDPTTLNRQGPDSGTQYRSVIFFRSPEQEKEAMAARERWNSSGAYPKPLVTEIAPLGEFYKAEEYHQKYFEKHGYVGCH